MTERLVFSDFLNLFFFNRKEGLGAVIKALEQKGLFQSLAEPNLIAYNGQEASFLAGGEFPIPVVQGTSGQVTVDFKEFGVKLNFRPTIAGDVIRLKVRPEVSALDFNNGVTLSGFRVPALTTRRAETDVELRDGQSFAIAGLLNNIAQNDGANIPFLSKIPIIGYLFKSNAERLERSELMVLVTPRLVRPFNPDEVPPLPTDPTRFLPAPGTTEEQVTRRAAEKIPMTKIRRTLAGGERGAVLVHVAVAMLALIAFSALAIDYGALLVSRSQAQNAADAAALAGASRWRSTIRTTSRGPRSRQRPPAKANLVLGAAPSIVPGHGRVARQPVPARRARSARHLHPCGRLPQRRPLQSSSDVLRPDPGRHEPGRPRDGDGAGPSPAMRRNA